MNLVKSSNRFLIRKLCITLPSDIGLIYLIFAIIFKEYFYKALWYLGEQVNIRDRFIYWLLIKIASDKVIVMATGESKNLIERILILNGFFSQLLPMNGAI